MGTQHSKELEVLENATPEAPKGEAKGISYEVILSPRLRNDGQPQLTPKRERVLTRQDVDEKMAAAERRRKTRELNLRLKLASNDEHAEVVRQAMTDYEERKRRETEARYQRRLYIFAENRGAIAAERVEQWENKARKIEAAKEMVHKREKSFRESVKEKLNQKFEKFKENYHKYQVNRQETVRMRAGRPDIVQHAKELQIEQKAMATAEKIKRKHEASQENREASISEKVAKIQKQQAKIEEAKESLNRSLEVSSAKKLMQLEVRLDRSAAKRQLFENKIRKKAKADLAKVEQAQKLREEREQKFSETAKENLENKFENAEKVREQSMAARQRILEKQIEREQKIKILADESEKLRERMDEKQQRTEENRAAILNAKVEQCQREYTKIIQAKKIVEEKMRNQEKATEEKFQAKLNTYKENRQRHLSEWKVTNKTSNRASLQEITNENETAEQVHSPRAIEECSYEDVKNENYVGKMNELAENFRNRNLEYLGLK